VNSAVIDASVAVKWFTDEKDSELARGLLDTVEFLHAPELFRLETAAVILKWTRRKILAGHEAEEALTGLAGIPIRIHRVTPLIDPAYELARITGAAIYDCVYLALAVVLSSTVITADSRFLSAVEISAYKEHAGSLERWASISGR
jgi:predicted nucleic acid-binding protein